VPKGTKVGTFDLSGQVITAIKGGKVLFAIDQQQYLQGYLPVVFGYLFVNNLNTVGGGQPILTGPGIVNKANAARVEKLAKAGRASRESRGGRRACPPLPPTGAQAVDPGAHAATHGRDRRPARARTSASSA